MSAIQYFPAGPVVDAFHNGSEFVRGLMGPVGSSKSSACFWELVSRGMAQKPHQGRRRVRWLVVRQTYPELKSTTIDTCVRWMPNLHIKWDAPITGKLNLPLADGTVSEQEFVFLPVERPDDVKKLLSFEATGAWLNEAKELDRAVLDIALQRVGRFPSGREGGCTWSGLIADTNPPDTDHWWYKLFENLNPEGYRLYRQPGALLEEDGRFNPNPLAENLQNYGSHDYWLKQVPGKTKDWVRVYLCGQYGVVSTGKPVYPNYNDDVHCKPVEPNPHLPLILGWDFGLAGNAVAITQLTKRGQLVVLDELCAVDMGLDEFAASVVKPHLAMTYQKYDIRNVGDPAGMHRSTNEAKTCFQTLAEAGFALMPAITNDPMARIEAVRKFLNRMTDGQPGFLVDPKAQTLRSALRGKYCFERVQVTGKEIYRDKPVKNEYSHIADGCGYAAIHVSHVELNSWSKNKKIEYPKLGII